jgi:hypothetical protein
MWINEANFFFEGRNMTKLILNSSVCAAEKMELLRCKLLHPRWVCVVVNYQMISRFVKLHSTLHEFALCIKWQTTSIALVFFPQTRCLLVLLWELLDPFWSISHGTWKNNEIIKYFPLYFYNNEFTSYFMWLHHRKQGSLPWGQWKVVQWNL